MCARQDLNPEPLRPKRSALSVELRAHSEETKERSRTLVLRTSARIESEKIWAQIRTKLTITLFSIVFKRYQLCYDLGMQYRIPDEVAKVGKGLRDAGFESYLVGGCVRDLIIGIEPKDWDITTNATPEQIQATFPDSFYENDYGTVGVKTNDEDPRIAIIEVTPYRLESGYSDKRRPDKVEFGTSLLEDLARRDFTINAIALNDPSVEG